ncbi:DUF3489 domain-containing protein [Paracoccus aurantiacus]
MPDAIAASQRPGTKQAQHVAMLEAPEGATIAKIAESMEWQAHSIRGAIFRIAEKEAGTAGDL